MLHLSNIGYKVPNIDILQSVELQIYPEFNMLYGGSGSGKTTLLSIMSGLLKPTSGQVTYSPSYSESTASTLDNKIDIFSINNRTLSRFHNKSVGFIYQYHHLMQDLSVFENIALPLKILSINEKLNLSKSTISFRVEQLLSKLNILNLKNESILNLSGGEKQRVAVARALINEPDLIFADEPTGSLDSQNTKIIIELLKSYKNKTVFMVSHNDALKCYSDRLIYMNDINK